MCDTPPFLATTASAYDRLMTDDQPTNPDSELSIQAISFDRLVNDLASDLSDDAQALLRAASDSEALGSEIARQLGESDGA
jgi:hypothetical protein